MYDDTLHIFVCVCVCVLQILTEDGVIACESWPSLKELIIYDNPLTRTSKGIRLDTNSM